MSSSVVKTLNCSTLGQEQESEEQTSHNVAGSAATVLSALSTSTRTARMASTDCLVIPAAPLQWPVAQEQDGRN